jgi:hypothetical protein
MVRLRVLSKKPPSVEKATECTTENCGAWQTEKRIWKVLNGNVTLHVLSHYLYSFTSQEQELHCCTAQRPPRGVGESCCAVKLAVLLEFLRILLCLHRHVDGRGGDCVGDYVKGVNEGLAGKQLRPAWLVAVTDRIN